MWNFEIINRYVCGLGLPRISLRSERALKNTFWTFSPFLIDVFFDGKNVRSRRKRLKGKRVLMCSCENTSFMQVHQRCRIRNIFFSEERLSYHRRASSDLACPPRAPVPFLCQDKRDSFPVEQPIWCPKWALRGFRFSSSSRLPLMCLCDWDA